MSSGKHASNRGKPAFVSSRWTRISAAFFMASSLITASLFATTSTPANAWPWDPTVTLNGKIGCNYSTSNTVQWAWVSSSDGESGWASLGSGGITRPYSFTFHHAPTSTMTVTVNWGCAVDGKHSTSFGVNRPAVGETATRDICYWSICRL